MVEPAHVFAGLALDRHAEQREDATWALAQAADPRSRYLVLREDARDGYRALVAGAGLRLLGSVEQRALLPQATATYLGEDAAGPLFSIQVDAAAGVALARELAVDDLDLRGAGLRLPAFDSGLFAYARALAHWQSRARWCGACGARLELLALGHRARCSNPACGIDQFPRLDPAIIVIVGWQDRCLLGRQASWQPGRWSTLAGFVEPGESLEDAVRREVHEEAGVRVGACHYHSSQPWPFPAALMLGFSAEAEDPAIRVGHELAAARWFSAGELVDGLADGSLSLPPRVSVSRALIAHWLRGRGVELDVLESGHRAADGAAPAHRVR
ncbi:MAG: NAD(+) diphosphatase [Dokdonella sp.]|nr:MAG: NAD(+) diphosphatase [Dokdonella sp.]